MIRMIGLLKKPWTYISLAILLFAGWYICKRYIFVPELEAEIIKFEIKEGELRDLADYRGKPMLVHFYANWCGPCMKELPHLTSKIDEFRNLGLEVVCLTDDSWDEINRTTEWLPGETPLYKLTGSLRAEGIFSIPQTFILNSEGQQIHAIRGAADWDDPQWIAYFQDSLGLKK
jgi:peroxiredoxin